jgi:hypothetical protein
MLKKYPRTYHLPWSLGKSDDDKVLDTVAHLIGQDVVITEKMDGENTTLYPNGKSHARSLDSSNHPSRDWVKAFWASRCYLLPEGFRVCGENVYAKHSIGYNSLPSYFMGFSAWEGDTCLSWDDSVVIFNDIGITPVRVIYRGIFNEKRVSSLGIAEGTEGYVVRLSGIFSYGDFKKSVAKCVRANHVQTGEHWMTKEITKNSLTSGVTDQQEAGG